MWSLLILAGCPLPPYDTDKGETAAESADVCVGVSPVTWDSFGQGFVATACQECHSAAATDRQGAPQNVNFDTVDEVWTFAEEILMLAGSEPPSMPPDQGTSAEDRELLRGWLGCGQPGT